MTKALRGINLGGWLIVERWMTPELFEGIDEQGERAIGRLLGNQEAAARLRRHRDTFITEKDFKWIKSKGFDVVRLPVGYWLFEEDHGFVSGEDYVDKAFEWARRYSLGVILDFHGLQGSQNGHDHSGQVGKARLFRWFSGHERRALRTMEYLARKYGKKDNLIAIELINEPKAGWFMWRLLRYYDKAFRIVDRYVGPEVKLIVSDAFQPRRMARALARRRYGFQLVLDVHLYQVFDPEENNMSLQEHVDKVHNEWRALLIELGAEVEVMVGEWSAALPAAAYDGLTGGEGKNAKAYYDAQRELFEDHVWAHCYWSYKAPGAGVWDYKSTGFWRR